MESSTGDAVIVFNGEIFNYIELRNQLKHKGHIFRSTGDTEVLLAAYEEWGEACVDKLNGMWAFAIYDRAQQTLTLSRDRFGIKPLYIHRTPSNSLLIASEIKAIRDSGLYDDANDWPTVADFFLRQQLDHTDQTFYKGIKRIPAGTLLTFDLSGQHRARKYWSLSKLKTEPVTAPPEAFAELFEDSVRLRLRSDVPVGVCLSGGLDSTSIICSMARQAPSNDSLYAFSFNSPDFDEGAYIAETIQATNATLVPLATEPAELWASLSELLYFQDEPVHSMTAMIGYKLMALARQSGVKVVLNGQGADEVIGGYQSYRQNYWSSLLSQGRISEAVADIRVFGRAHGLSTPRLLRTSLSKALLGSMHSLKAYRQLSEAAHRRRVLSDHWFSDDFKKQLPDQSDGPRPLNLESALRRGVDVSPLPVYLRIEDRNSMAHSVEVRVPFLDFRLVQLVFSLDDRWKVRGAWNKYILRESMRGRIPESVRTRLEKMGFPVPVGRWFEGSLYEPMMDLLNSRRVRERGIYNVESIKKSLAQHRKGEVNVAPRLFDVAQFETLEDIRSRHRAS